MPLGRIVLYVKGVESTVAFYEKHFGFQARREPGDRIVELISGDGGEPDDPSGRQGTEERAVHGEARL